MASTFSPSLRIELIGDGDQSGIWGQTTNNNLGGLIEQAISGVITITLTDSNYTLSNFNGVSDEARNQVIVVVGTVTGIRNVSPPIVEKTYVVQNNTTGGFAIRVIGTTGQGVLIPNGTTAYIYCDGTNFNSIINGATGNFNVAGNLAVTGTTTLTGAATLSSTLGVTGATSLTTGSISGVMTAPTAAVTTDNTQIATTAFVRDIIPAGVILMWSSSIATIPSGWLLCDGTNGTPNLVDRFVVGAGFTYQPGTTGGSANAVLVSHTHTASVTDPQHFHVQTRNDASGAQQQTATGPSVGTGYATANGGSNPAIGTQLAATGISVTNSTEGVSGTNANLPPYYALVYIMKA
jgi:hypothetical protein